MITPLPHSKHGICPRSTKTVLPSSGETVPWKETQASPYPIVIPEPVRSRNGHRQSSLCASLPNCGWAPMGPRFPLPAHPSVFSLYDTCYVNSLVTLGPCSLREQIPWEGGCILHNWIVGCIQREVFAEHIESQPQDPHVRSASTWQTARASLECRGQKGIFLKSKQASGVMAHSKGCSVGKGVLAYPCQALPHLRWTQSFLSHLAS